MATVTYETTTCTRCGGTGEFSYCQRFGTMCFKCKGKGKVLTKRGEAAALFAKSILELKVEDAVGQLVWADVGFGTRYKGVVAQGESASKTMIDGEWVPTPSFDLVKKDGSLHDCNIGAGCMVRKLATEEDIALIAEYQECLTKAGKPSKKSRFYKEQA